MAWRTQPANIYISQVQGLLTDLLGPIAFDSSPDGAWVAGAGVLAEELDQRVLQAINQVSPNTADEAGLSAFGRSILRERRPATPTRIALAVTGTGTIRATDTIVSTWGGLEQRWTIIEAYPPIVGGGAPVAQSLLGDIPVVTGSTIVVEAESGRRQEAPFGGSSSIDFVPTKAGITIVLPVTSTTGGGVDGVLYAGTDLEPISQYRARLIGNPSRRAGTTAGLRAALIDLPGVEGVDLSIGTSPGEAEVTVVGELAGGDFLRVAQTLYDQAPAFTTFVGPTSIIVDTPDGRKETVRMAFESAQMVDVSFELELSGQGGEEEAVEAGRAAVSVAFGQLSRGETVRYSRVYAALANLPNVVGVTLTLDSVANDVIPATATAILAPDFVSTTATPE